MHKKTKTVPKLLDSTEALIAVRYLAMLLGYKDQDRLFLGSDQYSTHVAYYYRTVRVNKFWKWLGAKTRRLMIIARGDTFEELIENLESCFRTLSRKDENRLAAATRARSLDFDL